MHFKCVFLIPALVSGQIASAGVDSCTGGDMVDWSRRTMFGHFWSADCPSQAKMLTVFMGQRKCKKATLTGTSSVAALGANTETTVSLTTAGLARQTARSSSSDAGSRGSPTLSYMFFARFISNSSARRCCTNLCPVHCKLLH